jgi:hypothetical protein
MLTRSQRHSVMRFDRDKIGEIVSIAYGTAVTVEAIQATPPQTDARQQTPAVGWAARKAADQDVGKG